MGIKHSSNIKLKSNKKINPIIQTEHKNPVPAYILDSKSLKKALPKNLKLYGSKVMDFQQLDDEDIYDYIIKFLLKNKKDFDDSKILGGQYSYSIQLPFHAPSNEKKYKNINAVFLFDKPYDKNSRLSSLAFEARADSNLNMVRIGEITLDELSVDEYRFYITTQDGEKFLDEFLRQLRESKGNLVI